MRPISKSELHQIGMDLSYDWEQPPLVQLDRVEEMNRKANYYIFLCLGFIVIAHVQTVLNNEIRVNSVIS